MKEIINNKTHHMIKNMTEVEAITIPLFPCFTNRIRYPSALMASGYTKFFFRNKNKAPSPQINETK